MGNIHTFSLLTPLVMVASRVAEPELEPEPLPGGSAPAPTAAQALARGRCSKI